MSAADAASRGDDVARATRASPTGPTARSRPSRTGTSSGCSWPPRSSTAPSSSSSTSRWRGSTRRASTRSASVLVDQARAGCCVLFSSHQLDLVEDLCESVTIIDHGRLVAAGTVDDLATSGPRRLVVRVEGDRDGAWARAARRGQRSPRSTAGRRGSCSTRRSTARPCCARRWPRAGSPSSCSSAAGCPRCSGRRWREPLIILLVAAVFVALRLWIAAPVVRRRPTSPGEAPTGPHGSTGRATGPSSGPSRATSAWSRRARDARARTGDGSSGSGRCSSWPSWPPPSSSPCCTSQSRTPSRRRGRDALGPRCDRRSPPRPRAPGRRRQLRRPRRAQTPHAAPCARAASTSRSSTAGTSSW